MAIKPQLQRHAIVKCHRLGPKVDRRGDQQTRPILVNFTNESIRDDVLRARFVLKEHNAKHSDSRIFLNENLTGIRAKLAREARVLKKSGKIDDTGWDESYKDRDTVLRAARKEKPPGVFVNEDLSQRVMARRRELMPRLREARQQGKYAYLSYDRLVVRDRVERT